ncbi:hypothetical protein D3P08_22415 [Paenibacillus nanensis]|uniref:Uncharacterized protein n=1 Tax=Paenibacillus nanensis TaxID=393251 RepID=A0A3A1UNV8_9BACL|nr:CBO0543 family protein [Paenibacillus nanensis]RIX50024.1 hypothetical protein D3P08_22415 [Paenibacillus nanensis]
MSVILLAATIFIFLIITLAMKKKIPLSSIYAAALFAIVFATLTDFIFNLQLGLYGYFNKGIDIPGYFIIYVLFPLVNIVFLNFYPFLGGLPKKGIYIAAWSAFALGYELLSVRVGMFYYSGWEWWYSALLYPFCLLINLAAHKLFLYIENKS